MNIVIDYPENFPLTPVDRDIYAEQLLAVLRDPRQARMYALDDLRKWAGLPPIWSHHQRDVLETLLSMMTGENRDAYRDSLIAKTSAYLGVGIRAVPDEAPAEAQTFAATVQPRAGQQPDAAPRWQAWIDRALLAGIAFLVGICTDLAIDALTSHPAKGGALSGASFTSGQQAVAMPGTNADSPVLSPLADIKVDTRKPARALASLVKLAPTTPGEYLIELTISPVIDGPIETQAATETPSATGPRTRRGQTTHGEKQ